jgi:hypothetical protein
MWSMVSKQLPTLVAILVVMLMQFELKLQNIKHKNLVIPNWKKKAQTQNYSFKDLKLHMQQQRKTL